MLPSAIMAGSFFRGLIQLVSGRTPEDPLREIQVSGRTPEDPLKEIQDVEDEIRQTMTKISTYCGNNPLRIVLCGSVKVGKSSLVNNILSAFKGKVVQIARAGEPNEHNPDHITGKYLEYKINMPLNGDNERKTHFLICDTRGIDKEKPGEGVRNVIAALDGYYVSAEDMDTKQTADAKKTEPNKRRQAAHIIIVVDATVVDDKRAQMIQSSLARKELISVSVFLTKCDSLDRDVSRDIQNLYKSKKVEEAINHVHSLFNFVPKNRIFPVVNYTYKTEAEPQMRLQTLRALNIILSDVESYMDAVVRDV